MNLAGTKLVAIVIVTILIVGIGLYYVIKEDEPESYPIIDFDYSRAYDDLQYLAGDLPNRASGTDNERQAAEYISGEFNASGLTNVIIHEFPWLLYEPEGQPILNIIYQEQEYILGQPIGWSDNEGMNLQHHENFTILGFSGTENANDIELAFVGNGSEDNYTAAGDVSGMAVLVESDNSLSYSQIYHQALNHSAAVSLIFDQHRVVPIAKTSIGPDLDNDDVEHMIPFPTAYGYSPNDLIPHLMLDNATGYQMIEWIESASNDDDQRVVADIDVRVIVEERNVLVVTGDVKGATDDVIMLGAHMDTHYVGPGAIDNGVGTVTVLEVARQLGNTSGLKKTIRLATWGGEEIALLGSYGYYLDQRSELDDHLKLYLNFDMSHASLIDDNSNRVPFEVNDAKHVQPLEDIRDQFFKANPELAAKYDVSITLRETAGPSDHRTFNLEGIDTLTSYGSGAQHYHTNQDTLTDETINAESLQIAGCIEGSYALYMARR